MEAYLGEVLIYLSTVAEHGRGPRNVGTNTDLQKRILLNRMYDKGSFVGGTILYFTVYNPF